MPQFNLLDIGSNFQGNISEMVLHSGPTAKFVLIILLLFSIVSWTIIAQKYRIFKKARKETQRFLRTFHENTNLTVSYTEGKEMQYSPIAKLFVAAYKEIRTQQKLFKPFDALDNSSVAVDQRLERVRGLNRALSRTIAEETAEFEKALIFLATTGSTTPFIGLFGTVWGVMNAFRGIGVKGSTSIGVVAPGISEALIATAAGLAVAIPAVIFYNYFLNRVRVVSSEMSNFSSELIDLVEKNIIKS